MEQSKDSIITVVGIVMKGLIKMIEGDPVVREELMYLWLMMMIPLIPLLHL